MNDQTVTFGGAGLYPVVGDWNGDGIDTLAYKAMAGATWSLSASNTAPVAVFSFDYGQANTDIPYAWR